MAWRERLQGFAEEKLGVSVVPRERLDRLQESAFFVEQFREEITDIAYSALNLVNGRPHEMLPQARERLARRSRIALTEDPLAGAEATLLANFAFGRGVTRPDAVEEKVQEIIDEAWTDPVNREKLTGFEAQRHRSNELLTQANLLPTAYIANGRVRLGFLDVELVKHVVCDPEDDERPLWYMTHKMTFPWDFDNDKSKPSELVTDTPGVPRIVYLDHWRNVEDYLVDNPDADQPSAKKHGDGKVFHLRINRIGRTQWGTPPWARTLRFYSAMNSLTEAHVAMAQAASSIIAKRSMTGGPASLRANAAALISQTGELGAARFGEALRTIDDNIPGEPSVMAATFGSRGPVAPRMPVGPGAFWNENKADVLEPVNFNSGAGQATQSAQIVRAPIAAAAQFGQHYMGDASNANLATATSLELPALMNVQAWQETFEQLFRWFVDLVIQEAARSGRLGGDGSKLSECLALDATGEPKKLSELCLREDLDKRELERRTGLKLDYTFEMPYPGRRNLPDVTTMVQLVAAAFDPNGINVPLRRQLLLFLAKHGMQLDDPMGFVDEVMPEDLVNPGDSAFLPKGYTPPPPIDPQTGAPIGQNGSATLGANGGAGAQHGGPQAQQAPVAKGSGARSGRPNNASGDMSEMLAELFAEMDDRYRLDVILPVLGLSSNGGGQGE